MFYITKDHPKAQGTWALCKDGELVSTFSGLNAQAEALSALVAVDSLWPALVAAGAEENFATWEADPAIAFTETPTSDRRMLMAGEESFRDFPLPWMLQTVTSWGHQGAVIAGRIDEAKAMGDNNIWARGVFDNSPAGKEAERLARHGMLRGVSIDIAAAKVEWEITEVDEDGWPIDWIDKFYSYEIMGATQTPFPAFGKAAIKVTSAAEGEEGGTQASGAEAAEAEASGLSAAGILNPPASWFTDPGLTEPTPLTIGDDGRVFGHIATWNACHIGYTNSCVSPPKSETDYSYFATGVVKCDEGCEIPTGALTIGTGHADVKDSGRAAASHYDHTGTAFADVAIGEDSVGIWVAGGVRPGTSDEVLYAARASAPSGDWRRLQGNLELVAVLMVNVPGFNVPRGLVASGEQQTLIAASAPRPPQKKASLGLSGMEDKITKRFQALERRVDRHEQMYKTFEAERADKVNQLRGRLEEPLRETLRQRLAQ